ncbi:hypothetical protein HYPGJ_20266 [Hyphomicrobium sp. GJ21]|nr:hypothetical protein HYPGJ_20266 [Hyphomicrobium sp. GJ21]
MAEYPPAIRLPAKQLTEKREHPFLVLRGTSNTFSAATDIGSGCAIYDCRALIPSAPQRMFETYL